MSILSTRRMIVDIGVEVPMRDGVNLAADVYRPSEEGQWPTLLLRLPYDRSDPLMGSQRLVDPAWLARQGFAVVVQDTRGCGESEGDFNIIYQEVNDGYDTVEWAAAQPWSTGKVGIYGPSYMGITSYQAVASQPPHLCAAVAFIGSTKSLADRPNGDAFELSFYSWFACAMTMGQIAKSDLDPAIKADLQGRLMAQITNPDGLSKTLPVSSIDVISDKSLAPLWHEMLEEPGTREIRGPLMGYEPKIGNVALLHVCGYRDFVADHAFKLASTFPSGERHRFIATPFAHRGPYTGFTGARELPETSSPSGPLGWAPLIAAWFDIHLRGGTGEAYPTAQPWLQGDPVRYYLEGENRWENAKNWPPETTAREWHLASDGDARSSPGNGRILAPGETASQEGADQFTADPMNPFPTCGGPLGIPTQGQEAIQDQRLVDGRDDVLVYTSDVLTEPVKIAGHQQLALQFSSSAPDADICVTLVDVEPEGFAYNVCDGVQRCRYRNGGTTDWLEAGKTQEVTVTLHPTAHVFKPGHRIRVMIAGANFPRFSRNLHTKTVPEFATAEEAVAADHKVHHGPSVHSRLILNQMQI